MAVELMNPCGAFERGDTALAMRSGLAEGNVVGLFSNLKNNATLFLDEIADLLAQRYEGLSFVRFEKSASEPAEFTDEFLDRADFVVAAFAD